MGKWIKKSWWKLLIFVVVFIFLIPIAINWIYEQPAPVQLLDMKWSIDAVLTFYGGIVAALIAIYGVYLTIQYTQNNYKEDVRNRALPVFAIKVLRTKLRPVWGIEDETDSQRNQPGTKQGYSEYDVRDFYITVENGIISYRTDWTKAQRDLLQNGGVTKIQSRLEMQAVGFFSLPIIAESVGNGPALNVRCGFNGVNVDHLKKKNTTPIPVKVGDAISIHLFFENAIESSPDLGKYSLELFYQDILDNRYCQRIGIELKYDPDRGDVICVESGGEQYRVDSKGYTIE